MITRSDDYVEYCRETARHASDAHDLALRGRDKKEITRVIHERIAEAVNLHSGDDLVDIGCGDGTLLRIAERVGARSAIGLLATDEEVAVLRRFGLEARQALTDKLPLPDQCASVIVCNNVMLVVPREKIPASLAEIYRIARPGARIFLGEIPFLQPSDPTPHFQYSTGDACLFVSQTRLENLVRDVAENGVVGAAWTAGRAPSGHGDFFFRQAG